ncbi:MOSC domain-containing protein [Erythrobacter sp. YT30]|uniref:MOSC domain-containing protein n=1 Tax=Erythrobacter sp. YT30 TaxID=1735012 RepID=UPI00076C8E1B|nr:MOSC domain-containing protein [Erythrobacter sp. YT30]KWV92671.1 molybdenum cofactor biosysynthesis protein [Erythrobacter sp. YT30]
MATEASGAPALSGNVVAVSRDSLHRFSKPKAREIRIMAGLGVRGDAHAGETVQHLSRVTANPKAPNLRQVHLIHSELFGELAQKGFTVRPGDLGENITTRGIELLELGRDTLLRIGPEVVLSVTGLRNPCGQINNFRPGLLKHLAFNTRERIIRKAGIMSVALKGGIIRPGDRISIDPPDGRHIPLDRV